MGLFTRNIDYDYVSKRMNENDSSWTEYEKMVLL